MESIKKELCTAPTLAWYDATNHISRRKLIWTGGNSSIRLETDHKPLIPLLEQKLLDQLPMRVQRFRLRLMRYSYDISYVSGNNLHTADALSRTPIENDHRDEDFGGEVETYVESVMYGLECNVASTAMMTRIKQAYQEDPVCAQVILQTWLAANHVRESRNAGILSSPR